jgi:hypothetical protein
MVDALSRLSTYQTMSPGLAAPLERLRGLAAELSPGPSSALATGSTTARTAEKWRQDVAAQVDAVQQELRLLRRGTKFSA